MSSSGTYAFGINIEIDNILWESYGRAGFTPSYVEGLKVEQGIRSINLTLNSWLNRGLNLWTVEQGVLALNPNQSFYTLPTGTSDVLEVALRTSIRRLGGTPFSSAGGTASNAFDGNINTACTQNAPNGYISYSWGNNQYAIQMVGIQSAETLTYQLVFEYSNDNTTWTSVLSVPSQEFVQNKLVWFVVPVPINGKQFRVRELGGETLNIEELYFSNALNDTSMGRVSRMEYVQQPNKNLTGSRPTSFWVNRGVNPNIYIWPTPSAEWNALYYTRIQGPQDITSLTNTPSIPARFVDALCAEVGWRVGVKETIPVPNINLLKAYADESFNLAAMEDRERVPLNFDGSYKYAQGYYQS